MEKLNKTAYLPGRMYFPPDVDTSNAGMDFEPLDDAPVLRHSSNVGDKQRQIGQTHEGRGKSV
jgi:hypothetical protein